MVRSVMGWAGWLVTFLCACTAAVPSIRAPTRPELLVLRPGNYRPVELSPQELQGGMRMLMGHGRLPGAPRPAPPRLIAVNVDPVQFQKAAGYLELCEKIGGGRRDCWEVLTPTGGLDASGSQEVALRIAFGEALREAASAVGSITPDQVSGRLAYTVDAGRTIGIDRTTGVGTSIYTVITDATGNLITAFPGLPVP